LDETAYQTFEMMLKLAKPDMGLICQCQTGESAKNKLAKEFSSSIQYEQIIGKRRSKRSLGYLVNSSTQADS
jgi:hypothetical protein